MTATLHQFPVPRPSAPRYPTLTPLEIGMAARDYESRRTRFHCRIELVIYALLAALALLTAGAQFGMYAERTRGQVQQEISR